MRRVIGGITLGFVLIVVIIIEPECEDERGQRECRSMRGSKCAVCLSDCVIPGEAEKKEKKVERRERRREFHARYS